MSHCKRRGRAFLFILMAFWGVGRGIAQASVITAIDFKGTTDPNELTIQSNGQISFTKQENEKDNQVILELKPATISVSNSRKIDTSSFNSKVTLISPYQVEGQADTVRVVIQMRSWASIELTQDGNVIKASIPNEGGGTPSATRTENESPAAAPEAGSSAASSFDPPATGAKSNLDSFIQAKETQKFTGKPVTLQVKDADVSDVLRLIGETSGFNMIVGDDVKGKISLSLVDVPWDQALDVVLHTLHLGAERNNNILRVVTLKSFLDEKQEQLKAEKLAKASAPRITQVFPISYAKLEDLQSILLRFATQPASGASTPTPTPSSGASSDPNAAIVMSDNRTNSLVVRDVSSNIDKMKKLIEILDTQTPQVMIEAKIVEATEGFSTALSGSLGVGGQGSTSFLASFSGGNPLDALIGTPGVFATGTDVAKTTSTPAIGSIGLSPSVSFLPGVKQLNAMLNWGESDNQVKIVSSPKTVVLNKESATIVQGTPVLVPGTTTVNGVGTVPVATVLQANISLTVKPTVTNDAGVLLDLNVSKDVPFPLAGGQQGIGNRNLKTVVLVESGTTLVIGGIYTMQVSRASSGFPFLRKLPLIGALFGNESQGTDRSELFIFITPKILNVKEAGLSG